MRTVNWILRIGVLRGPSLDTDLTLLGNEDNGWRFQFPDQGNGSIVWAAPLAL